jgi:prolyl-tRNA synthetase
VQVVVLIIKEEPAVRAAAEALVAELRAAGHRVRLDDRTETSFGRRSVDWELKGVPVRVEIGPRDLAEGRVTVVTRHIRHKENLDLPAVGAAVAAILSRVGPDLLEEATKARQDRTVDVDTVEEAIEAGASGFARIRTEALGNDGEDRLAAHALSIRCLQRPDGGLAGADDDGDEDGAQDGDDLIAVVGRSY